MYLYLNPLTSHHILNSELINNYQKGYTVDSIGRFFIKLRKNQSGDKYFIHVSSNTPGKDAKNIKHSNGTYRYFSKKQEQTNVIALKDYSQSTLHAYRNMTYTLSFIVFIIIASTYVLPGLRVVLSIISIIILIVTSFRSVNQRKFFNKVYLPFLKDNHFLDEYYENRFLINTPVSLGKKDLDTLSEKGKISVLKSNDNTHNYMMVSLLQRQDVIELFKNSNIIYTNISSIVKQ